MKLQIVFDLDESWDVYRDCNPMLIAEDAIRELAEGVTYNEDSVNKVDIRSLLVDDLADDLLVSNECYQLMSEGEAAAFKEGVLRTLDYISQNL